MTERQNCRLWTVNCGLPPLLHFPPVSTIHETSVRVRYAETDQMGVVYYANYFIWFEIGRVEFMRHMGFDYRNMEREDGCFIAVADARCRYKAPARYDEVLAIRTRLKGLRGPVVQFEYEILRPADATLLAEGETSHIVTDAQMKTRSLPEKYRRAFQQILAQ
jgi:acyl-CoA thioester hydrolase